MLAIGVKESTKFNSVFTGLNLLVVIYVVVCGSFKLDFHNWNLDKSEVSDEGGKGGFMVNELCNIFFTIIMIDSTNLI